MTRSKEAIKRIGPEPNVGELAMVVDLGLGIDYDGYHGKIMSRDDHEAVILVDCPGDPLDLTEITVYRSCIQDMRGISEEFCAKSLQRLNRKVK
jgi:hypothetical protein